MPFHLHHHHQSSNANSPAGAIYQAAQALGSIGAPTGNLRLATQGTTTAGTDSLLPGSGNAPGLSSPAGTGQESQSQLQSQSQSQSQSRSSELHIATGPSASASSPQPPAQQMYNSPDQYSTSSLQLQQHQPPQPSPYASAPQSSSLPTSLQPAASKQPHAPPQRPAPTSSYTAPTVPTMINSNAQQYSLPTRSNTMSSQHQQPQQQQHQQQSAASHAYSRSSPAGMGPPEQKYIPFSNTPDNKYAAHTPSQKYYPSTPSGAASQSPLGLADIRPRANSSMNDDSAGGHHMFFNEADRVPSNSNYLAPWPVYAFDWCKWNVPGGNSAGKIALGSYLEDTHNFVCSISSGLRPSDG